MTRCMLSVGLLDRILLQLHTVYKVLVCRAQTPCLPPTGSIPLLVTVSKTYRLLLC